MLHHPSSRNDTTSVWSNCCNLEIDNTSLVGLAAKDIAMWIFNEGWILRYPTSYLFQLGTPCAIGWEANWWHFTMILGFSLVLGSSSCCFSLVIPASFVDKPVGDSLEMILESCLSKFSGASSLILDVGLVRRSNFLWYVRCPMVLLVSDTLSFCCFIFVKSSFGGCRLVTGRHLAHFASYVVFPMVLFV